MSKTGMINLNDSELNKMEMFPNYNAIRRFKQEPYYLKAIKKEKEQKKSKLLENLK